MKKNKSSILNHTNTTISENTEHSNSQKTHRSLNIKERVASLFYYFTKQLKEEDEAMEALEETLEQEPLSQSRKKVIVLSGIIIVLLMGLVYYQNKEHSSPSNEPSFQAPSLSPIESDVPSKMTEFQLDSIQIPLEMSSIGGKILTDFTLELPEQPDLEFQIQLLKVSNREVLYKSSSLKGKQVISQFKLNKHLRLGVHPILLEITTVESQTQQRLETKSYEISVVVKEN